MEDQNCQNYNAIKKKNKWLKFKNVHNVRNNPLKKFFFIVVDMLYPHTHIVFPI